MPIAGADCRFEVVSAHFTVLRCPPLGIDRVAAAAI
jgi:hypothetical protein